MLRSDDLAPGEKAAAIAILQEDATLGNPHAVRCTWCPQTRTLFRDENDAPFRLTAHGWFCEACEQFASSQEIKF